MIEITAKEKCSGCHACFNVCIKNCIQMISDEEGFLYPSVNSQKCVSCGLCTKVCPILNHKPQKDTVMSSCVAFVKDDDVRIQSSSGGIFSAIAEKILSEGGSVYGAAFDSILNVQHIRVDSIEKLYKLRGSKYVQSSIGESFRNVKQDLQSGKLVLFTGTACQISGLKRFLNNEYENLLTVDILCHGTPSPKLWEKYLSECEEEYNSKVKYVYFRNKEFGWKRFSLKLEFVDSKEYLKMFKEDVFMRLFLGNICLRPSCYECRFKKLERDSDLTIGDAWGINKIYPDFDDDKGASIILVHSKKGKDFLDMIAPSLTTQNEEVERILPQASESRHSVALHPNRKKFFIELNKGKSCRELLELLPYKNTIPMRIRRKINRWLHRIKY